MEANRILVVEDDKDIREGIEIYLRNQGYVVFQAGDGVEGLQVIMQEEIHLAIVDIMMPRMDGITMMMKVRDKGYDFPVIMLSAKSEEVDKIMGLNMGADDYVTKPFELEVLHSRNLALLRRTQGTEEARMVCDDLALIPDRQTVLCGREEIPLSGQEYAILCMLMHNKGRTVTRRQLLDEIWDSNGNYVNDNTLTVTMKRLREKLHHPACLKTVRSFGYRMEDTL